MRFSHRLELHHPLLEQWHQMSDEDLFRKRQHYTRQAMWIHLSLWLPYVFCVFWLARGDKTTLFYPLMPLLILSTCMFFMTTFQIRFWQYFRLLTPLPFIMPEYESSISSQPFLREWFDEARFKRHHYGFDYWVMDAFFKEHPSPAYEPIFALWSRTPLHVHHFMSKHLFAPPSPVSLLPTSPYQPQVSGSFYAQLWNYQHRLMVSCCHLYGFWVLRAVMMLLGYFLLESVIQASFLFGFMVLTLMMFTPFDIFFLQKTPPSYDDLAPSAETPENLALINTLSQLSANHPWLGHLSERSHFLNGDKEALEQLIKLYQRRHKRFLAL